MTPAHGEPDEVGRRHGPVDESFEDVEPMPTFGDTVRSLGITAVVLLAFQVVTFYAVAADVGASTMGTLTRVMSSAPLVVFALSLLRRTARRARAAAGAPARRGTLRYDVFYGAAFACLVPAMTLPILLTSTSISAPAGGPLLAALAVAAGSAAFLARRRQRRPRG